MGSEKLIYQSWSCRFCHEAYAYKIPAERHAEACTHNPDNRTCDTCANRIYTHTVNSDGYPVTQCRVKPYLNDVYRADCEQWELEPVVKLYDEMEEV